MRSIGVLEEIVGPSRGRKHRLGLPLVSIGRSTRADIQIPHESVSRAHAEIGVHDGTFFVRDRASMNGTFLNDLRIDEHAIQEGDVLTIGRVLLRFGLAPDDGEPGSAPDVPPAPSSPPAASAAVWPPRS